MTKKMVVGLSIGSLPLIMVIDYCIAVTRVQLKEKMDPPHQYFTSKYPGTLDLATCTGITNT